MATGAGMLVQPLSEHMALAKNMSAPGCCCEHEKTANAYIDGVI